MAAHGFLAAQGLALCCLCFAMHGLFPAQGFAWEVLCERAAQGLLAPQGAAMAAPLIAATSAPEEIRVFAIVLSCMGVLPKCNSMAEMADADICRGKVEILTPG
jgi:hypothetical protein